MRAFFYLLLLSAIHYSDGYSILTRTVSATNPDSTYYAITSHVGTLGDSLGDSINLNIPFQINTSAAMDFGILTNDTLTDSVFIKQNNVLEWKQKIFKGQNDIYWQSVPRYLIKPNKYTFYVKAKQKAGHGTAIARYNFNYYLQ